MVLTLVHHADALSPAQDFERPLSSRGVRQAAWLAAQASAAGCRPAVIWHSGKRRARQTAEAFLLACNPSAPFRMVRGLRPEDSIDLIRAEIEGAAEDLLLAGHRPHIFHLLEALCPGAAMMPLHGAVTLQRKDNGGWRETWRAAPPADL